MVEKIIIIVSSFFIFLTVFLTFYFLLDMKTPTGKHRDKLLRIKYLGTYKATERNYNIRILKHYMNFFQFYKKRVKKTEEAYNKCRLKSKIDIKVYIIFKYFIFLIVSIMYIYNLTFEIKTETFFVLGLKFFLFLTILFIILDLDLVVLMAIYKFKKNEIVSELIYFMNSYEIGKSVGENTSMSFRNSIKNIEGILKDEIIDFLDEYDSGIPLKIALNNLAERINLDEVTSFIELVKRNEDNSYITSCNHLNNSKYELLIMYEELSKEQELTAPKRILFYSVFGFIAVLSTMTFPVFISLMTGL